jgi:acetyl-CoA C-acetyltransferase
VTEVLIASYARTAFTKAWVGGHNASHPVDLAATAISAALQRAALDGVEIDDVVLGCANPEGATGQNIGRIAALRAGLPTSVAGATVNRFCGSGLQAIADVAASIQVGHRRVAVAGGVESVSVVQNTMNSHMSQNHALADLQPGIYWPMLRTAERVAEKYGISRERQDAFALTSQDRAAAAQERELMKPEIVSVKNLRVSVGTPGPAMISTILHETAQDECPRPETIEAGLSRLRPVIPGGTVTAGNASPYSDGAAALVLANATYVEAHDLPVLGRLTNFTAVGCNPDEMGIGPVPAVTALLSRTGLSINDIDLWELNEAFASQAIYCQDALRIPHELMNVNGGAIAWGHPYGASGARLVGHLLAELHRRGGKRGIVTMCVGGGQGVAALVETV